MRIRRHIAAAISALLFVLLAGQVEAQEATAAASASVDVAGPTAATAGIDAALAGTAKVPAAAEPAAPAAEPAAPAARSAAPAAEPDESAAPATATDDLAGYDPVYGDDGEEPVADPVSDPLEPMNRAIFRFNESVDHYVLDPITRGYRFVVPAPARRGIERVFRNLKTPVIFANLLFQGRGRDAAVTLGRFVANTTLGVGGIFDYGEDVIGWQRTDADFGQTLAVYGMPSGPYLVVPIFGPSSARDAVGTVADQAMNPLTYFVAPLQLQWSLIFGGSQGLAYREANADALDALRDASVDFYAALRSAYSQSRQGAVEEAREARSDP